MRTLVEFLAERAKWLWELGENVAKYPITQGLVVEIDPMWLHLWLLRRSGYLDLSWKQFTHRVPIPTFFDGLMLPPSLYLHPRSSLPALSVYPDYDFEWHPEDWDVYLRFVWRDKGKSIQSAPPVYARVDVRPTRTPGEQESRVSLLQYVRKHPYPVVVVDRPRAQLTLSSGDLISANGVPGTLGGILHDGANRKQFGVSCGHVVDRPGPVTDSAGNVIGDCKWTIAPKPTQGGACTPRSPLSANANTIDASLVELRTASSPSGISGVTAKFGPHQSAWATGAQTGHQHYVLGGFCLMYSFVRQDAQGNYEEFCFQNLFELLPLGQTPLTTRLSNALAPLPRPGDSGAWITVAGSPGLDWCGMLVGAGPHAGYGIHADIVLAWAEKQVGTKLFPI